MAELKEVKKQRTPSAFSQRSVLGVRHSGGWVLQDPLIELQAERGIRQFMEMSLNDATVRGVLFAIEQVVRQVSWDAQGVGESDPKDREAKDFLRSSMNDMDSLSWDGFVTDILTFLPYGWSIFEEVYKLRRGRTDQPKTNSQFDDGRIGWSRFAFIHQSTWERWVFEGGDGARLRGRNSEGNKRGRSGSGEVMAFVQRDPNSMSPLPPISMKKLVLFKTKHSGGNPEGESILRGAWRSWRFKKLFEEIEGIGVERDLAGLPVLTPPEGFDWEDDANINAVNWAREFITHVRRDEYEGVILPTPEWKFELMTTGGRRAFDTTGIINRYDKRIVMSMLAQFLMLGMERIGSFALVNSLSDLWLTAIDGYVKGIVSTINRGPVKNLFDLNPEFDGIDRPKIEATRINTPNLGELAKMLSAISSEGGPSSDGNVDGNVDGEIDREEDAGGEGGGAGGGGSPKGYSLGDLLSDPEVVDELLRIMRLPIKARERRITSNRRGGEGDTVNG